VLNAIESVTNVKVISNPKLLVLNNREAQLQIGDQVPVVTQSSVGTSNPDAPIVNSVSFRDTGVILRVTPRVNKNGLVQLDIQQEVSDVVPTTTSGIDSPTIQQRKISSTVAVKDGETIALGGLIRERNSKSRSGVPILVKIPGLGALFRSTNDAKGRTELIVLLTPRVLDGPDDVRPTLEDLREQFRRLRRNETLWPNPTTAPNTPRRRP
jgi:general secretion pathway protein D